MVRAEDARAPELPIRCAALPLRTPTTRDRWVGKWDRRRYYREIGESVRRSVCAKVCFGGRVRARTQLHTHIHTLSKLTLNSPRSDKKKLSRTGQTYVKVLIFVHT